MLELLRGVASVALFAVFGVGALAISPAMLILRRPERCQPIVRAAWRLLLWSFEILRLVRVETGDDFTSLHGRLLVCNHPSLIDVVILTVLVPRTLYVAKHALRSHPVLAAIVRATSLPDDERLPETAAPYLAKGWNLLIFPEGTRSPAGGLHPFRRGAAQVALRTGAKISVLKLTFSQRILGKDQPIWRIGSRPVAINVAALGEVDPADAASAKTSLRARAVALTERLSSGYCLKSSKRVLL